MMVDENEKDEAPKLNSSNEKDANEFVMVPSTLLSNTEEDEDEDDDNGDYEEEEEEEEDDEDGKEPEEEGEEDVHNGGKTVVVVNNEGNTTNEEHTKGKAIGGETDKENNVKKDAVRGSAEKKAEEPKKGQELGENSTKNEKRARPRNRNIKKVEQKASGTLAANGDKPESSSKKNASRRVASMGMVFMCSSKTKTDCFRYKILGLPANKKDQVAKIYKGMRLFLFDVDLRLMYGIFKAAGRGGYNIEPKAFKSDFPSQVRFTVLDDCLPLAEEKFKKVIKENYYARNKFECLLNAEQVKNLCQLFLATVKGRSRPKAPLKPRRTEVVERRRSRADDALTSRDRKKRKRRAREEERRPREEDRRPRSPPGREKRRYTDYERPPLLYEREAPVLYERDAPVLYEREAPVPRYLPLPPPVGPSPGRSYGFERALDPYVRDPVPEHHTYRVLDVEPRHHDEILTRDHDWDRVRDRDRERVRDHHRDRDRGPDAYYVVSREAPPYHDTVYALPPEYRHVSSRDYHPPAVEPLEYRLPGGSRVPSYRDVGPPAADYGLPLHEYGSRRTHYRY